MEHLLGYIKKKARCRKLGVACCRLYKHARAHTFWKRTHRELFRALPLGGEDQETGRLFYSYKRETFNSKSFSLFDLF